LKKLDRYRLFLFSTLLLALFIPALLSGCTNAPQPVYAGETENDLPHGRGTKTYPDGTVYEGEFHQGYRHGEGTWLHSSGIAYSGQWHQDRYHNRGILTIPGHYTYDGQWEHGVKHGFGIQSWNDGRYYEGHWEDGLIQGEGIMHYPDGSAFQGYWAGGRPHGPGAIYDPDGEVKTGTWEYGELVPIPVESLLLNTKELTLNQNEESRQLLTFSLPSTATAPEITWSSADPEIATVEDGLVIPQTPGETVITASAAAEGIEAQCHVTVTPPPVAVTGVRIDRLSLNLRTNHDPVRLEAIIEPEEATNKAVTWRSENPEIASVNQGGLVTPLEVGETEIIVETADGGFSGSCRVTVRRPLFED